MGLPDAMQSRQRPSPWTRQYGVGCQFGAIIGHDHAGAQSASLVGSLNSPTTAAIQDLHSATQKLELKAFYRLATSIMVFSMYE
jgi:type 1 glutamine amidotransferase